jgi:hypothetical protein
MRDRGARDEGRDGSPVMFCGSAADRGAVQLATAIAQPSTAALAFAIVTRGNDTQQPRLVLPANCVGELVIVGRLLRRWGTGAGLARQRIVGLPVENPSACGRRQTDGPR